MAGRVKVLLLGGSSEATALAHWLDGRPEVALVASLKGLTRSPAPLAGDLVVGGFGGAARLARYLREQRIDLVLDATHPFAVRMARNARRAALVARVPRLKVWRPPWEARPGDRWHDAADVADAARHARDLGRRPFVSLGRSGPRTFPTAGFAAVAFRAIEPAAALPAGSILVAGRGPFTLPGELALLRSLGTDVLVTKNSGGEATRAKLDAARALGLPVVLVRRPPPPPPPCVPDVEAAEAWLRRFLAEQPPASADEAGFPAADEAKRAPH